MTLRDCVPSVMANAMTDVSKSKADDDGRVQEQGRDVGWPAHKAAERTGWATAEAELDNAWKRLRELEVENESIKKQLVESSTKDAKAKHHTE